MISRFTAKLLAVIALSLVSVSALAQTVQQSGTITPNSVARWVSNGVIGGGVTAADSPITSFGVTANSAAGLCVSSARSSAAGRNQLCLGAQTAGPGIISLQNYGTATAQDLIFRVNGNDIVIPTGGSGFVQYSGTLVSGHMPCFSGTSGLVVDCGVGAVAGTQYGLAYYTAAGAIGSIAAGTNGQIPVATTSGAPSWRTLSGDVASVSAAGAVTLQSVNGVTVPSSFQANGVIYAATSTSLSSVLTNNIGYCLLSQGTSSAPIWASCASGSGSAGGADTQVQFNNSNSLSGSANLTWVSPALRLGVAGTTTGQVQFNSSAGASGVVTVQAPSTTAAYNFNLPTGAGSSGLPLLSGGGGSTAMSFAALGVSGGGTGGTAASGTLLDNITGFSSTGYISRTGSGTYAFAATIPVSGGGTGLASGTSGGILGFTASGTLASSVALTQYALVAGGGAGATPAPVTKGTAGQILIEQTGANPAWTTMGTDATINSSGALTIANSAVTLAKMANAAAYSIYGNFTGVSAAPQVSTIGALTQKASPAAGDLLLLQDQAASGQLKYATVASVASAGSVSSIDSQTGAFTTANGITSTASANTIELTAARRTLPTTQRLTSGTDATYTTPANVLWIEVFMVGGGGGGDGSGTGPGSAGTGGATCWKATGTACSTPLYQASGGVGAVGFSGGAGGGVAGSATCNDSSVGGGGGGGSSGGSGSSGGNGGNSMLGGGAPAAAAGGLAATANTGGGGSGGGANGTAIITGAGGGAGGYCHFIINSPAATYVYTIGAAGTAGAAGSAGLNGGVGGTGRILIVEHYGS